MAKNENGASEWLSPENLLNLVKILAIAGAAIWSIYLFSRFEHTERDLELELLRSQNLQNELASELQRLQIKKSQLEIAQSEATQLACEQEIEVTDLGSIETDHQHLFLVSYDYVIQNVGASAHEVTYIVLQAFQVTLQIAEDGAVVEIGSFKDQQGVSWASVFTKGHYISSKWIKGMTFKHDKSDSISFPFEEGRGGTGSLDPREHSRGSLELAVIGRPNDLIGFENRIGIDGGEVESNRLVMTKKALLAAAVEIGKSEESASD
jgi:hypothetical protein